MPAPDLPIKHIFEGGLATDLGTLADVDISGGRVRIPYLTRAENVYFQLNGAIRKIGGTSKYNASVIESGEEIRGVYEYIKLGTTGAPTRKKILHAGTKVLADSNDGTFAAIITGLTNDAVPNYNVFEDTLIIADDHPSDTPRTWDQTTAAVLGGSPPRFSFSVTHANRVFAAGDYLHPSRLYYSELLDSGIWNSGTAGSIDVDPEDGDMITGIASYRTSLIIFKGPNFGSIHVLSGLTPDDFARTILQRGVGAAWQNGIFPLPNDLGFINLDGTIRSLSATDRYGNLEQTNLSRPITNWIQDNVVSSQLRKCWAATDFTRGYVLITLPIQGSTKPNMTLMYDYRFEEPRFATWDATSGWSVARMTNPADTNRPILFIGGNDGFVRKTQQPSRGVDDAAFGGYVKTPAFSYSTQNRMKTIQHVGLGLRPLGSTTVTFSLRDETGQVQSHDFSAGGGDTLGVGSPNPFTLGTSTLQGSLYQTIWQDLLGSGQSRQFTYEISNATLSEGFEIDAIYTVMETQQNPSYE